MPSFSALSFFSLLIVAKSVFAAIAITGPTGGVNATTGQRPVRQEFVAFSTTGPAFDLYIQALQQFEASTQSDQTSYFQIAGIHGYPKVAWDGVTGRAYQVGYCTHSSTLFPSWHRPYLALFEQTLWGYAQTIAAGYPASNKATYQAAAVTFRIPYWDWSVNAAMPDLVNQPTIAITTATGAQNITNPLYTYTFHPLPIAPTFPSGNSLSSYPNTVRYPNSGKQSQPALANAQLQANAQGLHDGVYQLFSSEPDYGPFSNTAYTDAQGNSYNSVENMHNGIHSLVGNGGHMGQIGYAGFDPIFWLHHANVDRLFAIWQAIYPNSYTVSEINSGGTYTTKPGTTETVNSPLKPFHADTAGTLYTSSTARYTKTFGYSYPEVVDWNVDATTLSSNVVAIVNNIYNPPASRKQKRDRSANGYVPANRKDYHWVVDITANKSAITESAFIHFFLGTPPTDPVALSSAPNLVASQSILIAPPSDAGTIPDVHALLQLTAPLVTANLRSLRPQDVLPYISKGAKQITIVGQLMDDSVVTDDALKTWGLVLKLKARTVKQSDDIAAFPHYGNWMTVGSVQIGGGVSSSH